jgi:protein kinase-like protein
VLPSGQPKLMDFGIAKVPAAQLTSAGEFFGTPSYMSPEQATGEPLDARSDVFSLGAVLYLMLTGVRAFDAPSVPGILARVAKKDPPAPSKLAHGLPAVVDDVVARALAKDTGQRYSTARMLAEDIEDVLAERTPRHRVSWTPPPVADDPVRSRAAAPPDALVPPPVDAATADRRASAPVAAVPAVAPSRDESLVFRLADRVSVRGVVALVALLAVGLAFPLASRRDNDPLPTPLTFPLPTLPGAPEPGHLELSLEHPLRSGTLRVYVDDEKVLEEPLVGRVTKKVLSFRMHKGSASHVLDVPPGEHVIRVQVDGSGYEGSRRIRGTFKSGETRRLQATVDGFIKKDLSLIWGG